MGKKRTRNIEAAVLVAAEPLPAPEALVEHVAEQPEVQEAVLVVAEEPMPVAFGEVLIDAEVADDIAKPNSVVKVGYKRAYAEKAVANGIRRKAAQRSTWDWLAEALAGECLGAGDRLDIVTFTAILEANGVDHSRWTNRNKGWEGRFRMTGRLALQRKVADAGLLRTADGEELVAPAEWLAKYA